MLSLKLKYNAMTTVKRILLTPGEPAGIGPELAVFAAQNALPYELVAIADANLLHQAAAHLGLSLNINIIQSNSPPALNPAGTLSVIHTALATDNIFGQLNINNAKYVVHTLQIANDMLLQQQADAVTTGPVQKSIINESGIAFSGHTEFFAEQSNTHKVVMMLATEGLRVALATTHLPLKDVSAAITTESLMEVLIILHKELQTKFAKQTPKILVCGLNPHAGEGGHLGMEEITTIIPVLEQLRSQGMDLIGPLPADTLFTPHHLADADAVLAMYHDQGLPVLKYKGFGQAVNITLGLPYIRTSVDHGTALDIAGKGICDKGSMHVALNTAFQLAQNI